MSSRHLSFQLVNKYPIAMTWSLLVKLAWVCAVRYSGGNAQNTVEWEHPTFSGYAMESTPHVRWTVVVTAVQVRIFHNELHCRYKIHVRDTSAYGSLQWPYIKLYFTLRYKILITECTSCTPHNYLKYDKWQIVFIKPYIL